MKFVTDVNFDAATGELVVTSQELAISDQAIPENRVPIETRIRVNPLGLNFPKCEIKLNGHDNRCLYVTIRNGCGFCISKPKVYLCLQPDRSDKLNLMPMLSDPASQNVIGVGEVLEFQCQIEGSLQSERESFADILRDPHDEIFYILVEQDGREIGRLDRHGILNAIKQT